MTDPTPGESKQESASQSNVDSVCAVFTRQWINGKQPQIEDVLDSVSAGEHSSLLRRLLPLEIEFRRANGEFPQEATYSQRFADFPDIVSEFFRSDDMDSPASTRLESKAQSASQNETLAEREFRENASSTATPQETLFEGDEAAGKQSSGAPARDTSFGYEVVEEIARGGMGVVLKARQKKLKRVVALKMILSGQLASKEEIRRFHIEAEAAAALDHPNIVPIYEVGEHNGQHFFSMGFVEGDSLASWAKANRPSIADAARLLKIVAEAVQYAHENGIVHRDLKPANILMDGDQPRITDFGLARNLQGDSAMTVTGQIMGTPSYMPPEQARGDLAAIGPPADVYSLGVILYELLAGEVPFKSARVFETLELVQNAEPKPPRLLNPSIDPDLDTIVLKCLRKNIDERYETAQELADEIGRYLCGEPILARRIGTFSRTWRWCKRKPITAGLIATIFVTAMSLTTALTLGRQVRDAQAVTDIRDEYLGRLKQPELDARWIESFDDPLMQIATLDEKVADEFRNNVHAAYEGRILSKLEAARLSNDDYDTIESALRALEKRGGRTSKLREKIEQRRSDWQFLWGLEHPWASLSEIKTAFKQLEQVLVPSSVEPDKTRQPQPVHLPELTAGNRVRIETRFDDSWRTGKRVGISISMNENQSYSFRMSTSDGQTSSSSLQPATDNIPSRSFEKSASLGQPLQLELLRNGVTIQSRQVSASELFGPLSIRTVRDRDQLSMQINELPPLEFRDVFPLNSPGQINCTIDWPGTAGLMNCAVWIRPDPESLSSLEQGDRLFDQSDYDPAFAAYQKQADETDRPIIRQEALTKAGICLTRLGRSAEAEKILSEQFRNEGEIWPALAGCELWAIWLKQNRRDDANGLFTTLSSRFRFDQLATIVSAESRSVILNAYFKELDSFSSILRFDPNRVARFEQATEVDRLMSPDGRGQFRNQLQLTRAYRLVNEFEQARDRLAELWKRFPDNPEVARHYARVLRMQNDPVEARKVVEETRERNSDIPHIQSLLLLERAKSYISQEEWSRAEIDVDQVLGEAHDIERTEQHENPRLNFEVRAWLIKGFLQRRRGETVAGLNSWRQGFSRCREVIRRFSPETSAVMDAFILGSLTGELNHNEIMSAVSRSSKLDGGNSPSAALVAVIRPETIQRVMVEMWQSERGLKLAESFAYEQRTMLQRVREPLQLAGATLCRISAFGGTVSPEQEEGLWKMMELLFDSVVTNGKVKTTHITQIGIAWKGITNFLGWSGVAPQLEPALRTRLAWLLGNRAARRGDTAAAVMYFETVLKDSSESDFRRLAEVDLRNVNNATGRVELRNETKQPVVVALKSPKQSAVDLEISPGETLTKELSRAVWEASIEGNVSDKRLSISKFKVTTASWTGVTIRDTWAASNSTSALPGFVPFPGHAHDIGRWQLAFREPATPSRCAVFSPDNSRVAVGEANGLIRVRDAETANVLQMLPGLVSSCISVSWNRDGSLLLSASNDSDLRIWSQPDGRFVRRIKNPSGLTGATFSPTSDEIATISWGKVLRLWSADGRLLAETDQLPGDAFAPTWSPDGQWVITSADKSGLYLIPRTLEGLGPPQLVPLETEHVQLVAWNSTADAIAVADRSWKLYVVRQIDGQWTLLDSVTAHKASLTLLDWEGAHLWTGSLDGHLKKWSTSDSLEQVDSYRRSGTNALARSLTGQFAFSDKHTGFSLQSPNNEPVSTGLPTRQPVSVSRNSTGTLYAIAQLPQGDNLNSGEVLVLSETGEFIAAFRGRSSAIFVDDETVLAAGPRKTIVRFTIPDHATDGPVNADVWAKLDRPARVLALANDHRVAVGCIDGTVLVLNPDGSLHRQFESPGGIVECLGWSNSRWLAAGYNKGSGQLWNANGELAWPRPATAESLSIADTLQPFRQFSWRPTTNFLAASPRNHNVNFWSENRPVASPGRTSLFTTGLAWNPDGTLLAQTGTHGKLQLLSPKGDSVGLTKQPSASFLAPTWSPDGSQITLPDVNGSIRRFRISTVDQSRAMAESKNLRARSVELTPAATTLLLPDGEVATMKPSGQLMSSSPEFDAAVVYLVETDDGRYAMLSPKQFRSRMTAAKTDD